MLKILLVDDSLTIRKIVSKTLQKYNYNDITEVKNGLEAIERLKEHTYDCVFLDINMPEMDGFGVLEWMKKEGLGEKIEVIAMSTEVQRLSIDEQKALGIDEAIPKPFTQIEFERIVISLLDIIQNKNELKDAKLKYDKPVIVTDDSMSMRRIIVRQLEGFGCSDISQASNGKEALEIINEMLMLAEDGGIAATVFLDLNMPVMDGFELIEVLEKKELLDKVRIILLSASLESAKSAVDGKSIVAALPKPFKQKEFQNVFVPIIFKEAERQENPSIAIEPPCFEIKVEVYPDIMSYEKNHDYSVEGFFTKSFAIAFEEQKNYLRQGYKHDRLNFKLFDALKQKVYFPLYDVDAAANTGEQMEITKGIAIYKNFLQQIQAYVNMDKTKFFETHYINHNYEYSHALERSEQLKASIKEIGEYLHKIKAAIASPKIKTDESHREKLEKYANEYQMRKKALEKNEEVRKELYAQKLEDFTESYQEGIDAVKEQVICVLDMLTYRYDKNFWQNARGLKSIKGVITQKCGIPCFSSIEYLEKIGENELFSRLTNEKRKKVLIVGVENNKSVEMRNRLQSYFKHYEFLSYVKTNLEGYGEEFAPDLILIDYERLKSEIMDFGNGIIKRFQMDKRDFNIINLFTGEITKKELAENTDKNFFDFKLKNYVTIPKNQEEYKYLVHKVAEILV